MNIVNGLVLLNKPLNITSNQALSRVKRIFKTKKAGLTGILDPKASGVLPICLGEATKISQYLLNADKTYLATIKVGERTTTGDVEGEIIDYGDNEFTLENFEKIKSFFIGCVIQKPPMFSALKVNGIPLYKLARKGIEIEVKSRQIYIYSLNFISYQKPFLIFQVSCSKGTYIRTLSEDICRKVGTCGHLSSLVRIESAGFTLKQCSTFEELERNLDIISINNILPDFPRIHILDKLIVKVMNGNSVPINHNNNESIFICDEKENILGIGRIFNGILYPKRLFNL